MSNNVRNKLTEMSKIFKEVIDEYESLKEENKILNQRYAELNDKLAIKEAEQEEEALLICNLYERLEALELNKSN